MVLRPVRVGVRVLVVGVLGVLGVAVLVLVVLHGGLVLMMALTVRVDVGLVGVGVLVVGVLGARTLGHRVLLSSDRPGCRFRLCPCDSMRMHADTQVRGVLELDDEQVLMAVEVLRLLADPTRIQLLHVLGNKERAVGDLAVAVRKQPSSVSQHLAKLRLARLVTTRRNGTQVLYRVANEHVSQLVADALRHTEHLGPGTPAHHQAD